MRHRSALTLLLPLLLAPACAGEAPASKPLPPPLPALTAAPASAGLCRILGMGKLACEPDIEVRGIGGWQHGAPVAGMAKIMLANEGQEDITAERWVQPVS
jgi:hypothetical protein